MKNFKTILIGVISIIIFITLIKCNSQPEKKDFDYSSINSLVNKYKLNEAILKIQSTKGLKKQDSINLINYLSFLNRVKEIENQLVKKDRKEFIEKIINFQNGNLRSTILYADLTKVLGEVLLVDRTNIYTGRAFINSKISLHKTPQKIILNCDYDDRFHSHIFTSITIESNGKKTIISKGSPIKGIDSYDAGISFELTEKQINSIITSKNSKLVFKTAITYNDRAYLNGTIWDIKGGEVIKYNDVSVFKERKAQILAKGEIKTFEVEVKEKYRKRFETLYEINKILKRNNIKPKK